MSAPDARLLQAAKTGNLQECIDAIRSGANVDAAGPYGMTALHWSANDGDVELTTELLQSGANPNVMDETGATPLIYTAEATNAKGHSRETESGRNEVARLLIQRQANVAVALPNGMTALHFAVLEHNSALVRTLLDAGANPDARAGNVSAWELAHQPRIQDAAVLPELGSKYSGTIEGEVGAVSRPSPIER
jgi:hypothetical protein